ncbi:MAG: hypothetical protein KAU36_09095 [candidate division Zixibacteria bacterium]|nr:hypothetical protein [candidate division Zixibacteria bacterium]
MKQYTHAWLALKAVQLLKGFKGQFSPQRNEHLARFLGFIGAYPSTFVRGAWFPDTVIADNLQGGHTWKYYLDPDDGRKEKRRPPDHNRCLEIVAGDLGQKISLNTRISDLPDRCEALGMAIRDMSLITNKVPSGDVVVFNDSQVALFFLMLAHYVCDAHVPVHCDSRDLNDPSKVHNDLEAFWESEVKKYYRRSTDGNHFDLSENQELQRDETEPGWDGSILCRAEELLDESDWGEMDIDDDEWRAFLGSKNNNFWDYLVGVCVVSFHMSLELFPLEPDDDVDYDTLRIMDTSPFKERVVENSPLILADAVNSVALLWLATWERWELLAKVAP